MKLVERLRADFGQFLFVADEVCRWSAGENTIFYADGDDVALFHELGHALCGHADFNQDVELLHFERDAWEKAREIGMKYGVKISEKQIENTLDGYRDWLHERSKCPRCAQSAPQNHYDGHYKCFNCGSMWTANDARKTALRRYKHH
jgi:ribosomal protein L37AE/L43A